MPAVKVLVFQNRFRMGGQERQALVHLTHLDRNRWEPVVRCLRLEGEHLQDLAQIGVRPESLEIRKLARPRTLWRLGRLAAQLRAEGVALVHAQDFYTNLLGTVVARLAGVPCIVSRVDLNHEIGPVQQRALALVSRAASRVLVNAVAIRELCLREGVAPHRVAMVRNGVDLAAFDVAAIPPPRDLPLDLHRPTVVQVGNMHHPVKGQDDLLAAMVEVIRAVPEAQLVLIGDGSRRPFLERLAAELGVAGHVRFAGHRRDVPAVLARAAVVVSASHSEGLSNAVLEGMAARRPLVGTAVGGTPEVVRDGVTGFLVPPGAPPHLARRIVALLQDPALALRMGEEGRALVERDLDVAIMRESFEALYRGALSESRPPAASKPWAAGAPAEPIAIPPRPRTSDRAYARSP
jgi:glycosyltransferase involved in cell wall biosynthesis